MRIGVVLAGGVSPSQVVPTLLRTDAALAAAVVIAADSGLDLAEQLGIVPDLVVGDLDSVSAEALARAGDAGIEIRRHSPDKDETDLELALDAAIEAGVDRIVLLGGAGGRLDHLLGNIGALGRVAHSTPIEAWLGDEYLAVVTDVWRTTLPAGALVSVVAWSGPALVSESGVRWPLEHRWIEPGTTLGISNESLGGDVEITVHEGAALVVVPAAEDLP